mmetsp:Transcript_119478/g.381189  ORF Transcript_119478/g.381189 Transcript_119478/m.381189 type:complete len:191 (+) Transcript_119478:2447-3019(+)
MPCARLPPWTSPMTPGGSGAVPAAPQHTAAAAVGAPASAAPPSVRFATSGTQWTKMVLSFTISVEFDTSNVAAQLSLLAPHGQSTVLPPIILAPMLDGSCGPLASPTPGPLGPPGPPGLPAPRPPPPPPPLRSQPRCRSLIAIIIISELQRCFIPEPYVAGQEVFNLEITKGKRCPGSAKASSRSVAARR